MIVHDWTWEDGLRTSSKLWRSGRWHAGQMRLCDCRGGAHTPQKVGMKGLVEIKTERFERLE